MGGEEVGSIYYDARIDTKGFAKDADTVDRLADQTANRGAKSFRSFASSAGQSFDSIANGIGRLTVAAGALFIGGALGAKTFIESASELQGMRASFESMTGSAKGATKVLEQLNKFSFETAFSTQEINSAARTLLGAGLAVKDLGDYMKNIGDIAGATGADLGRLTLPLSQALARGKLQTQDFYQILDSGAGKLGQVLREELAKRGMGDFTKAMEEGQVTSEILFDVIEKSAQKGGFAFQGAIKQAQTFNGRMSNLQETITGVALEVLGVNKATGEIDPDGIFAKLSDTVEDATKWLSENKNTIKDVANTLIDNAVPALGALAAAFVAAKVAAIGFSIAASANPIGLITLAITALIAGLTYLELKFQVFSKTASWLGDTLRPLVDFFNTYMLPVLKQVAAFVGGQLKKAWNDITEAFKQIYPYIEPLVPHLTRIAGVVLLLTTGPLVALVAGVTGVIVVLARLIGFVAQVWAAFTKLAGIVGREIGRFVVAVRGGADTTAAYFRALPGRILSALGNIGNLLYNSGRALITGFIDGIKSMGNVIKSVAESVVQKVRDFFPFSPAKDGPFSGRGYTTYSGQALMKDFAAGMTSQSRLVTSSANSALAGAQSAFSSSVMSPTIGAAEGSQNGSYGETTNNIGTINVASDVDADRLIRRLTGNQEALSNGLTPLQNYGAAA